MAIQAQRFLNSRSRLVLFGLLIVAAVYLLAVTPVTTYLDQREEMRAAEERYQVLAAANDRLEERARELHTDEEIARLARERYELVPEGQQAYAVMPPPQAVLPAEEAKQNDDLWDTVKDTLAFWN